MSDRIHVLVQCPRVVWGKYSDMPWKDVVAAAERGDDGLTITDSKKYGYAFLREGDKGGILEDKTSLYHQAWL